MKAAPAVTAFPWRDFHKRRLEAMADPKKVSRLTYPDLSSRSAELYERAKRSIPDGVSRGLALIRPHPIYVAWGRRVSGDVPCPVGHKPATTFEQVGAAIGGLDAVAVHVGEGDFADLAWRVGALGGPVAEERNPCGTAATPCSRRGLEMVASLSMRPVGEGNTRPLSSASAAASSRTASARRDNGRDACARHSSGPLESSTWRRCGRSPPTGRPGNRRNALRRFRFKLIKKSDSYWEL